MRAPVTTTSAPGLGRSLRWELLFTLATILAMAAVSLLLLSELMAQRRHESQEVERLRLTASGLAVLAAAQFHGEDDVDIDALESLLQNNRAGQVGVVALRVHWVDDVPAPPLIEVGFAPELEGPRSAQARVDRERLSSSAYVVIDEPIPGSSARRAVLRMIAQPTPWGSMWQWREPILVAGGIAALMLIVGGFLLDRSVLAPLRRVRSAALEVAAGQLETTVPEDGPLELAELARSFNEMTAGLRRQLEVASEQRLALQHSQRLAGIGRVAAGVAHEVGNPLAAILGYAEYLLDPRSELPDSARGPVQKIRDQTVRIQNIVSDLLALSRPSKPLALQSLALTARLDAALELVRADPRAAGVEIAVDASAGLVIAGQAQAVDQILVNLLVNACLSCRAAEARHEAAGAGSAADGGSAAVGYAGALEPREFSASRVAARADARDAAAREGDDANGGGRGPRPARVLVRARADANLVHVDVLDEGLGIDTAARERLFEPFFSTRQPGEGTGLGLAISRTLAEAMDGALRLVDDNAAPPTDLRVRGAWFRLTLARAPNGEAADKAHAR